MRKNARKSQKNPVIPSGTAVSSPKLTISGSFDAESALDSLEGFNRSIKAAKPARLPKRPPTESTTSWPMLPALTGWTVESAKSAIQGHARGQFRASSLLAYEMFSDGRVSDGLAKRHLALNSLPLVFQPADSSAKARKIAEMVEERWLQIMPPGVEEELHRWSILMGFSLGSISWTQDEKVYFPTVNPWNPGWAYYIWLNQPPAGFIPTEGMDGGGWYVTTREKSFHQIHPGDGEWLLMAPRGPLMPWMSGAILQIWRWYLSRIQHLAGWGMHADLHGLPWRLLKVMMEAREDFDPQKLFQKLQLGNLGSAPALYLPQDPDGKGGFNVELLEPKRAAHEVFEKGIERSGLEITIALTGHNQTTETVSGPYAAPIVKGVQLGYLKADANLFDQAIHQQVLRQWAWFNWGDPDLAPLVLHDTRTTDRQAEAILYQTRAIAAKTALDMFTQLQASGIADSVDIDALIAHLGLPRKQK